MRLKLDLRIKISHFVKLFVLSDFLLMGGWGFVEPIFAIFIIDNLEGATLFTVGAAASIYWLTKSLLQVPIAYFLDKIDGERDDFYVLIGALIMIGLTAFAFPFITKVWHLYVFQIIYAISFAFYVPSWLGMFSHHLDKDHQALDWSLSSTSVGLAAGLTGMLGGAIAETFGFRATFILAGIMSLGSAFIIYLAKDLIYSRKKPIHWGYWPAHHIHHIHHSHHGH